MPVDWSKYPPWWPQVRLHVLARAALRCECTGQCGMHHGKRCTEAHRRPARWFRGTTLLSLAHLCACRPLCANPAHLRAMCQRCHLRTDAAHHAASRRKNGTQKTPAWVSKKTF